MKEPHLRSSHKFPSECMCKEYIWGLTKVYRYPVRYCLELVWNLINFMTILFGAIVSMSKEYILNTFPPYYLTFWANTPFNEHKAHLKGSQWRTCRHAPLCPLILTQFTIFSRKDVMVSELDPALLNWILWKSSVMNETFFSRKLICPQLSSFL